MAKFEVETQNGKSLFLKDEDEIHRGGEGRIILLPTKTNQVAKIYLPRVKGIDEKRFKQLQSLDSEVFVRPIDLLYQNGKIVGYTMEYAGKEFFPLSAMFSQNFILRNGISDSFKHNLAQKLINAVKTAHFAGFIIGDLNQFNILVNLNGEVKFIDVDSYETPGHKHTGVLLDDIRDYYYQGIVSMNSDYFALSVLIFSMFTYMHPFKGIHQNYKTLAERMIHKIPVFYDDPLLKVPKCFQPIGNQNIQEEFNKMYLHGERFLISMKGYTPNSIVAKPQLINYLNQDDIKVKTIFDNPKIRNVYFNQNLGYIESDSKILVFKSIARGNLNKIMELDKKEFDQVYIGNKNIIGRQKQKLFILNEKLAPVAIQNFNLPADSIIHQSDNILIIICSGQMYWLYLDEVLNNSIRNKRTEIFSESISSHSGLFQNTGGIQRIFYNTGKDIASVKVGKQIKKIFQSGNVGLIQYIENKKVINQYFKITGLNFELPDVNPDHFVEFGHTDSSNNEGFVFEPDDNLLKIRRTSDFNIVSEIKCSQLSRQSSLFFSNAGIIAWENTMVYLLNMNS